MMKKTALIIDDNTMDAHFIQLRLEKLEYECHISNSGCEGIEYLKLHSVDLITVDVMMPIMDGIETIKIIRRFCDSKIIIITNLNNQLGNEEDQKFVNALKIDIISKPIVVNDIKSVIDKFPNSPSLNLSKI